MSLIELNESINSILFSVETFLPTQVIQEISEQRPSLSSYDLKSSIAIDSSSSFSSIAEAVNMMVTGDHQLASSAVSYLIDRCNLSGDPKLVAIKEMQSNKLLERLLRNISRFSSWPAVEIRAMNLLSIMVVNVDETVEKLHDYIGDILSIFYMWLSHANDGMRRELEEIFTLLDGDGAIKKSRGTGEIRKILATNQRIKLYLDDQRYKIEALLMVSAALAKLGKLLARKWAEIDALRPSTMLPTEAVSIMEMVFSIVSLINDASLLSEEIITLTRADSMVNSRMSRRYSMSTDIRLCLTRKEAYYAEHCSFHTSSQDDAALIEQTLVLCCICVNYFSEVMIARPRIAAHNKDSDNNILALLRQWIDRGCKYLKTELTSMQLEFDDFSNDKAVSHIFDDDLPIHELVKNASQSVMHLVGGSELNGYYSNISGDSISPNQSAKRLPLDDQTIRAIDERILISGLADVLVSFLDVYVRLHNLSENLESIDDDRISLPKNITMYLSQSLYQLSSRVSNRQALQANNAPLVLCEIFQCIVSDNKTANRMLKSSSSRIIIDRDILDKASRSLSFEHRESESMQEHKYREDEGSLRSTESSIISSSLDALAFFLNDAATYAALAASLQEYYISSDLTSTRDPSQPSSPHDILLVERTSSRNFVDAIRFIISLAPRSHVRLSCLRIVSILTEWHHSLKAVAESDVIYALVKICWDSDELEHIYEQLNGGRPSNSNQSMDGSNRGKGYTSPTQPMTTTAAPAILAPSSSSASSSHRGSKPGFNFSLKVPATSRSSTGSGSFKLSETSAHEHPTSSIDSGSFSQRDSNFDEASIKIAKYDAAFEEIASPDTLSMEETSFAILAIANISQAKRNYAELLLSYGLLDVALILINSHRMEICHGAIRCLSSLCPVIAGLSVNQGNEQSYRRKLELCQEALKGCSKAINNADLIPAARKDALIGLAELAKPGSGVWEIIIEEIASGPLINIVTILIDPDKKNRDIQDAAELVLKSIGFHGGTNDLRISSFSFDILMEWFQLKRSLSPQREAWNVLYSWYEDFVREYDDGSLWHRLNSATDSTLDSPLAAKVSSLLHVDALDMSAASASESLPKYSLPNPATIRKNIGGIFKAIPFCLGITHPHDTLREEELEANSRGMPSTPSAIDRITQLSIMRSAGSIGGSPSTVVSSFTSMTPTTPSTATATVTEAMAAAKLMEWLDHVPTNVLQLMDIFFASKLIQLCLIDILSLGKAHSQESLAQALPKLTSRTNLPWPLHILPKPLPTTSLLLPSKMYTAQTFGRISRVIERIISDEINEKTWSLSFRDSEFYGDFYETLLLMLGRCPRIIGLCIAGSKIEQDTQLGHLGGLVPSSIRFLSFRGCLSGDGVQALCILLKQHNAAIMEMSSKDLDRLSKAFISKAHIEALSEDNSVLGKQQVTEKKSSSYISLLRHSAPEFVRSRPLKGLVCLSITHSVLSSKEVEYIVDLLNMHHVGTPTNSSSKKTSGANSASTSVNRGSMHRFAQGLRYLDLSFNQFSDHDCADLLRGAANGPLEGLDLSGNNIFKGAAFLNAVETVLAIAAYPFQHPTANKHSCLRHLSLAHCNLSSKAVKCLLDLLQSNQSLASLDLSHNHIHHNDSSKHIEDTKKSMREFLKKNATLRSLDLSYMSLKRESILSIQLGLLENETMLLLPLTGNAQREDILNTMQMIRNKLAQNREKYLHSTDAHAGITSTVPPSRESSAAAGAVEEDPAVAVSSKWMSHQESSSENASSVSLPSLSTSNSLHILFSAPLAWRDHAGKIHPVEMLDYSSEREEIIQVFREVQRDISVNFGFATTESLRTALSLSCRTLHFAGHGHPSYLNFEDGNSGLQLIKVEQLISLLTAGGNSSLQFVFVSACYSRNTGQAFVDAGVPHVVCCKVDEMIQDSAAMAFTRAFYIALLSGHTVQKSFNIAREALKVSPYVSNSVLEGDKFILLPEDASHDQPMFSCPVVSNWPLAGRYHIKGRGFTAASWLTARDGDTGETVLDHLEHDDSLTFLHTLPSPPPDFEGRVADMYRVITIVAQKRLVTVVGEYGVGKSALTSAVCNYIADRGIFEDGVLFLRAAPASSLKVFLSRILHIFINESRSSKLSARLQTITNIADYKLSADEVAVEASPSYLSSTLAKLQELVITCLRPMRLLVVVDNIDNLLPPNNEQAVQELQRFLADLFERCSFVKLLVTSTETLRMRRVKDIGIVEASVPIGPLTLRSTLRLFAKLAPPLMTSKAKGDFIKSLTPKNQEYVTTSSDSISVSGAKILSMFGNGHPAKIVKQACQATQETVDELLKQGARVIHSSSESQATGPLTRAVTGNTSAIATSIHRVHSELDPLRYGDTTAIAMVSEHFRRVDGTTPVVASSNLPPLPPPQRSISVSSQLPPMRQPTPDEPSAIDQDLIKAWMNG
jgi:hypothetical protein